MYLCRTIARVHELFWTYHPHVGGLGCDGEWTLDTLTVFSEFVEYLIEEELIDPFLAERITLE